MKNFSNYTDYDKKDNLHFESKAVHGALGTEPLTGAVSMPIFQAVTYRHPALGESTGFAYSRLENPTRQELERTMAILEGGIKAFAFSSGQAANMAVFSLLNPGDHVLLSDDIYGGTFRIIGDVFGKYGIEHTYVEMDDLDAVKAAIKPNTKMLFVETPTNPMMKVADIQALSEIAKSVGALMVVDNTFLTPYFQNPLKLGADIDAINYNLFSRMSINEFKLLQLALSKTQFLFENKVACIFLTIQDLINSNCEIQDTHFLIDYLMSIDSVKLAVVLSQEKHDECKVSVRSKDEYSAQNVAKYFGGGGHIKASGCRIFNEFDKAINDMKNALEIEVNRCKEL